MSMDGKNRTAIITNVSILSVTLDYQTQVLYWVCDCGDHSLTIKSSNIHGTNQQTIYYNIQSWYYYYITPPGLTIYNDTLLLSSPRMSKVYKLGINGTTFDTFIDDSVLCRIKYLLKVTKQPLGESSMGHIILAAAIY